MTLSKAEAVRLTERIELRLSTIADNAVAVISMIEEAKRGSAHRALGYRSWTEYVAEKFGGTLARLGKADRLPFVELLADQGMSTRAIGEVVGVSKDTVSRDLRAGVSGATPDRAAELLRLRPDEIDGLISSGVVENLDDLERCMKMAEASDQDLEQALTDARRDDDLSGENVEKKIKKIIEKKTTGIDGKSYTKPEPKKPIRRPLTVRAREMGWELDKAVNRIINLPQDDRFTRNKNEVATQLRPHLLRAQVMVKGALDVLPTAEPSDFTNPYDEAIQELRRAVQRLQRLQRDDRFDSHREALHWRHKQLMGEVANDLLDSLEELGIDRGGDDGDLVGGVR